MSRTKVFLDTEFSFLPSMSPSIYEGEDPDLISVGLVAEDGTETYVVLTNGWSENACTLFVRDQVLSQLHDHDPKLLTRAQAVPVIEEFLDQLRGHHREIEIQIISDYAGDWQLLRQLLSGRNERYSEEFHIEAHNVFSLLGPHNTFEEELDRFWEQNEGRHHALVDARALQYAYRQSTLG